MTTPAGTVCEDCVVKVHVVYGGDPPARDDVGKERRQLRVLPIIFGTVMLTAGPVE